MLSRTEKERIELIELLLFEIVHEEEEIRSRIELVTPENEERYAEMQRRWLLEHKE